MVEHPSSASHPPGDRKQKGVTGERRPTPEETHRPRSQTVRVDPGIDGLLGCRSNCQFDHQVDQHAPMLGPELIPLAEQAQLARSPGSRGKLAALGYVVIVELAVQPCGLSDIPQLADRAGSVPIDQGHRPVPPNEHVPWRGVAVPDDAGLTRQISAPPGHPHRVGWGLEAGQGLVGFPEQISHLPHGGVGPGSGVGAGFCLDEVQGFPTVWGEATVGDPWRAEEALILEVP